MRHNVKRKCVWCRFQRCLQVGMKTRLVFESDSKAKAVNSNRAQLQQKKQQDKVQQLFQSIAEYETSDYSSSPPPVSECESNGISTPVAEYQFPTYEYQEGNHGRLELVSDTSYPSSPITFATNSYASEWKSSSAESDNEYFPLPLVVRNESVDQTTVSIVSTASGDVYQMLPPADDSLQSLWNSYLFIKIPAGSDIQANIIETSMIPLVSVRITVEVREEEPIPDDGISMMLEHMSFEESHSRIVFDTSSGVIVINRNADHVSITNSFTGKRKEFRFNKLLIESLQTLLSNVRS